MLRPKSVESRCDAVALGSNISVSAPFVRRCLTGSTMAPFSHPAHRTGQADFPHPALGQDFTLARATPSAASEPFIGVDRLPNLQVLHHVLRLSCTEVPFLHRRYPASAVLRTSPPPQGARPVPHGFPVGPRRPRFGASRVSYAFLVYMLSPLPRRSVWAYCFAHLTQPYQPSSKGSSGRPAHCPFRGLLGVHSRYGLHTRAVTNS